MLHSFKKKCSVFTASHSVLKLLYDWLIEICLYKSLHTHFCFQVHGQTHQYFTNKNIICPERTLEKVLYSSNNFFHGGYSALTWHSSPKSTHNNSHRKPDQGIWDKCFHFITSAHEGPDVWLLKVEKVFGNKILTFVSHTHAHKL